jgi:hypothetical protein
MQNPPPPCDPTKGPCTQPIDTAKCDPTKMACTQPCDPTKQVCTQPCDPTKTNCGPSQPAGQPPLYMGSLDAVNAALSQSGNVIGVVKDSTGNYFRIEVAAGTAFKDPMMQYVMVSDKLGTNKYAFAADPSDKLKLVIRDNLPMAVMVPNQQPVNNPPPPTKDSTVAGTNPPPDTTKPPLYKGTLSDLQNVLNQKSWKVVMPTPQGPVPFNLDNNSLKFDGAVTFASESGNPAHVFVFLGDKMDPSKPAIDPTGMVLVVEKPLTAGP